MRLSRFDILCVPGHAEDGSDSAWFVLDRKTRRCTHVGDGDDARAVAIREAAKRNKAPQRRRGR